MDKGDFNFWFSSLLFIRLGASPQGFRRVREDLFRACFSAMFTSIDKQFLNLPANRWAYWDFSKVAVSPLEVARSSVVSTLLLAY